MLKKRLIGIVCASSLILGACGDSAQTSEAKQAKDSCNNWKKDGVDGSEKCIDKSSHHYGSFIYLGGHYPTRDDMTSSSAYRSNNNIGKGGNNNVSKGSDNVGDSKATRTKGTSGGGLKGGFGSGSKSSGAS